MRHPVPGDNQVLCDHLVLDDNLVPDDNLLQNNCLMADNNWVLGDDSLEIVINLVPGGDPVLMGQRIAWCKVFT